MSNWRVELTANSDNQKAIIDVMDTDRSTSGDALLMMPLFPMRVNSPIKLEELYRLSPTFGSSTISISTRCKLDRLVPEKYSKAEVLFRMDQLVGGLLKPYERFHDE